MSHEKQNSNLETGSLADSSPKRRRIEDDEGKREFESLREKYLELKRENVSLKKELELSKRKNASNSQDQILKKIDDLPTAIKNIISETRNGDALKDLLKNATLDESNAVDNKPVDEADVKKKKKAFYEYCSQERVDIACAGGKAYTIIIANLMMAIFTQEELLTSNLTKGEKSEIPNVLDQKKVAQIEAYILARFPNSATISRIRDKIRYKLRDVRARRKEEKSKEN